MVQTTSGRCWEKRKPNPLILLKTTFSSHRLEDWRKKSSNDFHLGLGKKGVKEELELMNDVNEETLADNETCEEAESRNNLRDQPGLTVGFSSLPDQIYRKSLRKGDYKSCKT